MTQQNGESQKLIRHVVTTQAELDTIINRKFPVDIYYRYALEISGNDMTLSGSNMVDGFTGWNNTYGWQRIIKDSESAGAMVRYRSLYGGKWTSWKEQ